ncbi:MAG: DUF4834 family protein [Bacteroidia bacterium]|nr:DUF4834 family protein [Bacteroidia bacterium]
MSLLIVLYITNFIKTLFIIAVIYYGIRIFTRYILPSIVDKGIKNMQQKMNDQHRQQRPSRPEGDVIIEKNQRNSQNTRQNQGEYVDFEEVE